MFGFNWVDLIIILILADAFFRGMRIGAVVELCTAGGFFGGLIGAGWLYPHLLPIHDPTTLTLVNGNLVILTAILLAIQGYVLGRRLRAKIAKSRRWRKLDKGFGIISVASAFVVVWLLASAISRLPFAGLSNSANDSFVVERLDHLLPPIPSVLALFNRQIDPNSPPSLFTERPSPSALFEYSPDAFRAATRKSAPSVVRLTGFGCGGVESGTGFVVADKLIATNAHVVAGIERPIVKYNGQSYAALPVLFDPNLDFAILRIPASATSFHAAPLQIADSDIGRNITVAIVGYPSGDYVATPGIVRDDATIFGRNIYGVGTIGRATYGVQATVANGSSGSPMVLEDGRVAGVIFSKDQHFSNYAYALTSSHLTDEIAQAKKSYQHVNTGACIAD